MEPRISIITLGVSNLQRSRTFYVQGLGWKLSSSSDKNIAFIKLNNIVLALFPKDALAGDAGVSQEGSGFPGFTLAHNVGTRELVDQTLEKAVEAGATLAKPAEEAVWGGYSGYFADPDGYLWEVAWNPHFPLDAFGAVQLP